MRVHVFACVVVIATSLGCGTDPQSSVEVDGVTGASPLVACTPDWSPTWQQASANGWWVEYSISGSVSAAALEVVGVGEVPLTQRWNKWVGGSSFRIASGAQVVLHAQDAAGRGAQTVAFAYLLTTRPTTAPCSVSCVPACTNKQCGDDGCGGACGSCASGTTCETGVCIATCVPACGSATCGDDGCGGSCGMCGSSETCEAGACVGTTCASGFEAAWAQGSGANGWWVDYSISGANVASASLEIPGRGVVTLASRWGRWVGSTGFNIARGSSVVLHATDTLGRTAVSAPFGYLVDTRPATEPCAGDDGGSDPVCSLTRAMISITFDDGYASQYTLARQPLLDRDQKATVYVIERSFTEHWNGYLSEEQTRGLIADGHELASHSVTHDRLSRLSDARVDSELKDSQAWLEATFGVEIEQFASPYGESEPRSMALAKSYYASYRAGTSGLNYPGDDVYNLKCDEVFANMRPQTVRTLIANAVANKGWLILVFHNFAGSLTGDQYTYPVNDFATILDDIAAADADVVTVGEGIERMGCGPSVTGGAP